MESKNTLRLLEEFPAHTYAEWKEAAIQLLKGRSFEKTLITPTYEGFDLEPIYTRESVGDLSHLNEPPGMGSQVRGSRLEGFLEAGWLVSQELSAPTPAELNRMALKELENGQNELNLWLDKPSREGRDPEPEDKAVGVCGVSLSTVGDLEEVLKGIHPEMISLYLRTGLAGPAVFAILAAWQESKGLDGDNLSGCLGIDPVGWLTETGKLPGDAGAGLDSVADLCRESFRRMPRMQVFDVQGHSYHNGGASSVQEAAAVLATGVFYLKEMEKRGIPAGETARRMRLSVSIGGNFFLEIAKLRALRLLWNRVLESFEVPADDRKLHLHARTGLWNKTVFDPYVNMLRTTTEAFSAVVGGCDSLHVGPFDEIIRESDPFSRRIARNTHAILAEECGMRQVIDPAGGSWAVETLTDKMAQASWEQFQQIEAQGGILEVLQSGYLQEQVKAVRAEKMKAIQRRKDVIIGTNTYPNATEKLLTRTGIDYPSARRERIDALRSWKSTRKEATVQGALKKAVQADGVDRITAMIEAAGCGGTLGELMQVLATEETALQAEPILLQRAAEEFEALRRAAGALSAAGKPTLIHQLNMGPSRRYRIRADWTSSFFQVGGFKVLNEEDFTDQEAALQALKASGAKVAVITSDDETYASVVEPLAAAVKGLDPSFTVIVAGAPGEHEERWRKAGVDDFVHVRVNTYTFNRSLLEAMGAVL